MALASNGLFVTRRSQSAQGQDPLSRGILMNFCIASMPSSLASSTLTTCFFCVVQGLSTIACHHEFCGSFSQAAQGTTTPSCKSYLGIP
eukprot:6481157-Karenia_brevis.AAC.1